MSREALDLLLGAVPGVRGRLLACPARFIWPFRMGAARYIAVAALHPSNDHDRSEQEVIGVGGRQRDTMTGDRRAGMGEAIFILIDP